MIFSLSSCSITDWVYIRNLTDNIATIDVVFNNLDELTKRPITFKTADKIVIFKNGHKSAFTDSTNIVWLDSSHFQFKIRPQNTIDLDALIFFYGAHPANNIKILVTSGLLTDTLMTSQDDFRRDKFKYKQNGFFPPRPILYYDIRK